MYYDGAPITPVLENAPDLYITIPPATLETRVWFKNPDNGETLAGIVRMPIDFERSGWGEPVARYPAIVFNGPIGSIKEQTQSTYAKWMSSLGYVTLVFDDTTFGESTGEPRRVEAADVKVSDIKAAVDYMLTLDYVDPNRIGGVGICGGGGFMAVAASQDRRIKAYAGIVPFGFINTGEGGGGFFARDTAELEAARAAYEAGTAPAAYGRPIQPGSMESAYYLDPRRGAVPNYRNIGSVTWSSLLSTEFDLTAGIQNLSPTPLLVIAPEQHLMETAEQMDEAYTGTDKEYYLLEGASHYEVYDLEPWVSKTVGYMEDFFAKRLQAGTSATE
jgi:fermentation-respiration switch protein FrsA (DUF1100 family)